MITIMQQIKTFEFSITKNLCFVNSFNNHVLVICWISLKHICKKHGIAKGFSFVLEPLVIILRDIVIPKHW